MSRLVLVLVVLFAVMWQPAGSHAATPSTTTLTAEPTEPVLPDPEAPAPPNPVTAENRADGNPNWQIPWSGRTVARDTTHNLKGYASATSVRAGESIDLFVHATAASTFTYHVFRLGWYGGDGGRLFRSGTATSRAQPTCPVDPTTGMVECQWARSATIDITSSWTSGIYAVVLTSGSVQNYVYFTVRDDRKDAVLVVSPINTDQAYNNYPNDGVRGKSLYDFNSHGATTVSGGKRAVKTSFQRPMADTGATRMIRDIAPFVRYAEERGYDLSYATDVDLHLEPGILMGQRAAVIPGHSEYWTASMYDAAEAARDSGVSLAFLGANDVYWQTRVESDARGVPGRVVVCYKNATIDPETDPSLKTVQWRQVGRPEQSLIGQMYSSPEGYIEGTYSWVVSASNHWFYRGTRLANGGTIPRLIGHETNLRQSRYPAPVSTSFTVLAQSPTVSVYGSAAVAESTLYRAPSGAWVFSAGSLHYTFGLGTTGVADPRAQAMTSNVLNRMVGASSDVQLGRLAGRDRYATAILVSETTFDPGVPHVYLATGLDFPDAVSASAATRGEGPILLVPPGPLRSDLAAELVRLGPQQIRVLGSTASVPAAVVEEASALTGAPAVRYAGANRYDTAVRVSQASFGPGVDTVYVATGQLFPDALAAGAAGAQTGSPVLLTHPTTLASGTRAEIARLAPRRIVIVGSPGSVSAEIEQSLSSIARVVRLGGPNRYATARMIFADLRSQGSGGAVAIATGLNFPDAIAAGPAVAAGGGAIVLVGGGLDPSSAEDILRHDPAVLHVLGSTATVSAAVESDTRRLFDTVNGTPQPVIVDPTPPMPTSSPLDATDSLGDDLTVRAAEDEDALLTRYVPGG
jgi:hypothetical protein